MDYCVCFNAGREVARKALLMWNELLGEAIAIQQPDNFSICGIEALCDLIPIHRFEL